MAASDVIQTITQVAQSLGLPPAIPLSIAGWETRGSYDPTSTNQTDWNGYSSVGVFQINTAPGNMGFGYTAQQLQDPMTNATIAEEHMVSAYDQAMMQGLTGTQLLDYVANNSGWPDSAGVTIANQVEPSYDRGLNAFYTGGGWTAANHSSISLPAPFAPSTAQVTGAATALKSFDDRMQVKGFDILHPFSFVTDNGEAIALRTLLVIVGLLLFIFGLYATVKKGMES